MSEGEIIHGVPEFCPICGSESPPVGLPGNVTCARCINEFEHSIPYMMPRVKSEVMDPADDSCNEGPVDIKEEIDIDDTHHWSLIRETRADIKREQGEENGCKSQSSSVHTQLDNCDGHNPENYRPIAQDQGQCSGSMDTTDGLDQFQHNSDDRDQCSDHNKQHLGIGERGLPVREEEIVGDEHFINYESFSTDSSNRFTIKQEHIKEEKEEDLNEMESDGGCNSVSTMMQIQDISSVTDTAIIVNFKNETSSIDLDKQDLSAEGIGMQGSSASNECADKSPDQFLFTDNQHVHSSKSYRTNNKSNLTTHSHTHTGERPYICDLCEKTFTYKSHLNRHLHTHTGEKPYSCGNCDKSFTQKSTLTIHLHTHTGERPYSCGNCNKSFSYKSTLTKHLRTHTGERPYRCEFCVKAFTSKSELSRHLHTHTGERPYHCEYCDRAFTSKSNLTKHLRTHTGLRPYNCGYCDKTFTENSHLTKHLRTHTGLRPYSCGNCDKTFTEKSHLTKHLHTHTGDRPYHCEFCDRAFTLESNLNRHLHTHTGERPYHCEFCDKSFIQKSTLTTHLHTHTGERPYHCEFCEKTFITKSHLTKHSRIHSGERPYSCGNCDKTFSQKSNLTKHIRCLHTGDKS